MAAQNELASLPSVERLSRRLVGVPHPIAVQAAREVIAAARIELQNGSPIPRDLEAAAAARVEQLLAPSLRRVLNATGVIIHTNLGRAPLPALATRAVAEAAHGYVNLEYDTEAGRRGSRQAHLESTLTSLTGADAALVVNNCAGAVLLAASALARGGEIVVSRGQLIEIGGSFRIPDVIAQSGARLVEVGTTNRTRLDDYRHAVGESTRAILRAHPSNFRTVGFVEEVVIEALCTLGVPVIDDAGSGAIAELPEFEHEPSIRRSVAAGCAVVCFSGDKLLGGPQAGLLVGQADAIERCRAHPLARALRIDKLSLAALDAILRLYLDPDLALREIPVLRMLRSQSGELHARAELIREALVKSGVDACIVDDAAKVGGGALPLLELAGPVCAVDPAPLAADELAARLRRGRPAVVGRVRRGRFVIDPRTLDDEEAMLAAAAVIEALR